MVQVRQPSMTPSEWATAHNGEPDPRLRAAIVHALGDAKTILNVGAGAGSYEPSDRSVVALEPSSVMLAQHGGSRRIRGSPNTCPLATTPSRRPWRSSRCTIGRTRASASQNCDELPGARSFSPGIPITRRNYGSPWTTFLPSTGWRPAVSLHCALVVDALGAHSVERFEIPHDFTDGFQAAYWRRPEMYLDPLVRAASSTFASLPPELVEPGIERLRTDLRTGQWTQTYGDLLDLESADFGHRIVIAG